MDTDLSNTPSIQDVNKVPTPQSDVIFDEKGRLMVVETAPIVEAKIEQPEIRPNIETAVETQPEKPVTPPQEAPVDTPTITAQPTATPKEQITTLNVIVDKTIGTPVHSLETVDQLSLQADKDENNFIENVDTAHDKSKTIPK